jgi:hypothetical protein
VTNIEVKDVVTCLALLLWPVLNWLINQYQLKYDTYLYSALLVLLLVLCIKGKACPSATSEKEVL